MEVNIYEAKAKLSSLIERAMLGEDVVISKAGKPMVKLVRLDVPAKRQLGSARGMFSLPEGWDAPMDDAEYEAFLGSR